MNAARPAVHDCWPYQSVKIAPSRAIAIDVGRLVAHHSHVVRADVELPDVVAPDDEDVGLGLLRWADDSATRLHKPANKMDAALMKLTPIGFEATRIWKR